MNTAFVNIRPNVQACRLRLAPIFYRVSIKVCPPVLRVTGEATQGIQFEFRWRVLSLGGGAKRIAGTPVVCGVSVGTFGCY